MKNRIMDKLRSTKGASITFALLLFLVCAVLCSVILAAATAASGRMSKIAENDQRYYCVSSAAELLKELLDGKSVSYVKVSEIETVTTYVDGQLPSTVVNPEVITRYIVADKKAAGITKDDFIPANLVGGGSYVCDSINKDAGGKISISDLGAVSISGGSKAFNLTSEYSNMGLTYDVLAADIAETMDSDGNLSFTISNKYKAAGQASDEATKFSAHMEFGANMRVTQKTESETTSATSTTNTPGDTLTVTTVDRVMDIVTLTWNLRSISFSRR